MHSTRKKFIVSQLNNLFLYFSPFQSYFTLTVYCQEYSIFVHLEEISFIGMQGCTKPYWWAALLRLEWVSLAWGCVIKMEHGKSLFPFICLALKCLHQGPKSFATNNVWFWGHFPQICLCLLLVMILSIQNPASWWECSFQAWINGLYDQDKPFW